MFLLIEIIFLFQVAAQWTSESYGIINPPFTSIDSMGLVNNFIYCIGNVKVNDVSQGGNNQVWATRIDINSPWSWSYSDETYLKQITVKHSKLGIQQSGIMVLPFWGLSPRETPDLNHLNWLIPVSSVDMITGLSASGGVYGLKGNRVFWIPVIEPFSLSRPTNNSTNSLPSLNSSSTPTLNVSIPGSTLSNQNVTFMNSSGVSEYLIYPITELNTTMLIWLGLDSTTLYMISSSNGTQMLFSVSLNGQYLTSSVNSLINIDGKVVAFIVHPRTFDYYFAIDNTVRAYSNDGNLRGIIIPTFPIVTSLEIDNDGTVLYIGGRDEQSKGRLDVFDLERAQLSTFSSAVRIAGPILMAIVLYLF